MRKTKKKDNPGANIGNALLGCIVLAVITVGFAIEMRKEGVGESAIMGIVFLSFFWAIMLAVLVTALWRRSHSDAVPKVRNLGPKAIVCLMGFFFATVGGGALFIEFSRALAKGTPLVSLEVLGMAAFLSIFFLLGLVMIGIGVKAFVGNKPRIARAVYGEALKRCGHVGRFEPHYHVTISCDALKPGAIVLVNYSLDGNGDADGLDVDGLEVFVWQVNEELRFLADGDIGRHVNVLFAYSRRPLQLKDAEAVSRLKCPTPSIRRKYVGSLHFARLNRSLAMYFVCHYRKQPAILGTQQCLWHFRQ